MLIQLEKKETAPIADKPFLVMIVLIGLGVRLLFLFASRAVVDGDEAIVGLMARHINEGRTWPVFYYGQSYMGSLEAILVAALFRITGPSPLALKTVPLVFSVWLILAVYALARRYTDRFGARVAALLTAVGPVALVEWSVKARGGFIELVFLGTAALILAADLLRAKEARVAGFVPLGLVLGLAWWVNNQAIFYLIAVGVAFLLTFVGRYSWRRNLLFAVVLSGAFFAGSIVFWYANLLGEPRFATFTELGKSAGSWREAASHLGGVFSEALPILFGSRRFWSTSDVFLFSTPLVYLCYLVAVLGVLFSMGAAPYGDRRPAPRRLVILFALFTPLIFAASGFGWLTKAPRYLLPLYSVLFVFVGITVSKLVRAESKQASFLGYGVFVMLLTVHLASNYLGGIAAQGQPFVAGGERVAEDHTPLYAWLAEHNYRHIRTNYWIGYRAAFETGEEVTFSIYGTPRSRRIERYQAIGRDYDEWAPYVLVRSQEGALGELLAQRGFLYRRTQVGDYVVFDHVRPLGERGEEVVPAELTASSRQSWTPRLVDDASDTRWGSGEPQRPGMMIQAGFGGERDLSSLVLEQGLWPQDAPRWLTIEAQTSPDRSCILFDDAVLGRLDDTAQRLEVNFAPLRVRTVRLIQQGSDPVFDWSEAEVQFFSPGR